MAEDPEFWPSPEFLTNYEILMHKINNARKNVPRAQLLPNLCFPAKFPFDFGSCASSSSLNSPVESALGSIESESDDEDLLAGLTQQLSRSTLQETHKLSQAQQTFEKNWAKCGSPKSTLMTFGGWSGRRTVSSNGSPNEPSQVPSPRTSTLETNNDAWDLIYQAAGQVARLKMSEGAAKQGPLQCPTQILSSQVHSLPPLRNPNFALHCNQRASRTLSQMNHFQGLRQKQRAKQQWYDCWGLHTTETWPSQNHVGQNRIARLDGSFSENGRCGRPLCLAQTPSPGLQAENNYSRQCQNQQLQSSGSEKRPTFFGGSEVGAGVGVKRSRAGTGVFLPRRYNKPAETSKGQGRSTAMIPAKVVPAHPQCLPTPHFYSAFFSDNDLMVQRNAMLGQQKRIFSPDSAVGQEICLPQEWTY